MEISSHPLQSRKVIEIIYIRGRLIRFQLQLSLLLRWKLSLLPLGSRVEGKDVCAHGVAFVGNCKFQQTNFHIFKRITKWNHQGNCDEALAWNCEKLQMLWLKRSVDKRDVEKKNSKSDIVHSRMARKYSNNNDDGVKWNHHTADNRQPFTSRLSLRLILPAIRIMQRRRWSNFLEIYNLWIKTLLNNWYITSFSENVQIPKTWLRLLSDSAFWSTHCCADKFFNSQEILPRKDARYSPAIKYSVSKSHSTCA